MSVLTRLAAAAVAAAATVSLCVVAPVAVAAASPLDDLIAALNAGSSGPQAPPSGSTQAQVAFGDLGYDQAAFVTVDGSNPCVDLNTIIPDYAEQSGFHSFTQGFLTGRAKTAPPCNGFAYVLYTVRDRDKRPWAAFAVGYESSGVVRTQCQSPPPPPAGLRALRCDNEGYGVVFR